jgi:site-specific DNA recombinase
MAFMLGALPSVTALPFLPQIGVAVISNTTALPAFKSKNFLYRMLNNRAYIGEAVQRGTGYAGEHERMIDQRTWEQVQSILQQSPRLRASNTRAETPALLKGLLYGPDGAAFSPTHTRKGDRLYRYYVSQTVLKHGAGKCVMTRWNSAQVL